MNNGFNNSDADRYRREIKLIAEGGADAKAAFTRLHDRYQISVLRAINKKVSVNDYGQAIQLELAQEVWLIVWTHSHQFKPESNPEGWLRTIAKNYSINYLRSGKNRRLEELPVDADEWLMDTTASAEHHATLQHCVEKAFEKIEVRCRGCRDVLLASILDGYTTAELAEMLDTSLGGARQRLYECRNCLRSLVEECTGSKTGYGGK